MKNYFKLLIIILFLSGCKNSTIIDNNLNINNQCLNLNIDSLMLNINKLNLVPDSSNDSHYYKFLSKIDTISNNTINIIKRKIKQKYHINDSSIFIDNNILIFTWNSKIKWASIPDLHKLTNNYNFYGTYKYVSSNCIFNISSVYQNDNNFLVLTYSKGYNCEYNFSIKYFQHICISKNHLNKFIKNTYKDFILEEKMFYTTFDSILSVKKILIRN